SCRPFFAAHSRAAWSTCALSTAVRDHPGGSQPDAPSIVGLLTASARHMALYSQIARTAPSNWSEVGVGRRPVKYTTLQSAGGGGVDAIIAKSDSCWRKWTSTM